MRTQICIAFGGVSAEHEVSVITGLQVAEKIDRSRYDVYCIYIAKDGRMLGYGDLPSRKSFLSAKSKTLSVGRDAKGSFFREHGAFGKTIRPNAVYMAFHGGTGESGPFQGLLESFDIALTSSGIEGAVITMNKGIGKEILASYGLPVVEGVTLRSVEILANSQAVAHRAVENIGLPVIVKPAHLGSSIGIHIVREEIELEKRLLEAAYLDAETVVERFIPSFREYSCAVRMHNGHIEASEIESPIAKDAILSFADKYQRGGGKKSGHAESGMASLQRELPAKVDIALRERIIDTAKKAFIATRCKGSPRIDFMVTPEGQLYITEINPIPGSMGFYLWEAKGISFTQQITDAIEQAMVDYTDRVAKRLDYSTDIIEKFVNG